MKFPARPTQYKHGDLHKETGRIFCAYFLNKTKDKWYEKLYKANNLLDAQIEVMYNAALARARAEQVPFDLDIEFLKTLRTDFCPIFGITLSWGQWDKHARDSSPSLDRIKPEYGYIKGNVCIISYIANKIKQDVGYEELYKVADWLHRMEKEVIKNVRPEQLASIPKKSDRSSKNHLQLSLVLASGAGEDDNYVNNYRGATQGENTYRSAKEGC